MVWLDKIGQCQCGSILSVVSRVNLGRYVMSYDVIQFHIMDDWIGLIHSIHQK